MASANDIRRTFLDYFGAQGHEIVPSSPLVPHNDPTLMFVNSGMVQFKNVFTGLDARAYSRAVTAQKCVRAGGKHNDLENVGYTARHHTFFEMLGNFSFGDYFKDLAIELAWNLVTKEYGLPAERLWVTVYHEDEQAFDLWRKIAGLPEARIVRIPTADNFWAMGDTGPCGPCSEIFYDHGPGLFGGPPGTEDQDGDRYVEIWNLVFMQYEQITRDQRNDLPKPSIDTGMGLERIAAVLQGSHDNYATDGLRGLILASAEATGTDPDGGHEVSHRVIADHLRASSFLIADGVTPSNEGRGYVLRRIMRRAMRHVYQIGADEPLMYRLVPALVRDMGEVYRELVRAQPLITETLKLEETRFAETLARGMKVLEVETAKLADATPLPGEIAFRLYDTYGFPLDLTQDILRGRGRPVDTEGFERAMERQREAARAAWTGSGQAATETLWFEIRARLGATEFLGYATESAEAVVEALVVGGEEVARAEAGQEVAVVLNQTPFYGESGGQMGDAGMLASAEGGRVLVRDTQKEAEQVLVHFGTVESGQIAVGDALEAAVDAPRRQRLRLNHSATHLLHEALRRALGEHVTQKGSLVAPDRLRFDFSHPKPVGADELAAIEAEVNARIRANSEVETHLMAPEAAVEAGALALFGEKYGEEVRVVSMGGGGGGTFSTELCGGTHVARTGDIGLFKLVAESPVAAGVRRVEALTGAGALAYLDQRDGRVRALAALLKAAPDDITDRVEALVEERRRLERGIVELRRKLASGGAGLAAAEAREVGGVRYLGQRMDDVPANEIKGMIDDLKRSGPGVYAIVGVNGDKATLVVGVTDDLAARFSAIDLVRAGVEALGGKGGGGRPDMAQGGGPDGTKAAAALAAIQKAMAAS